MEKKRKTAESESFQCLICKCVQKALERVRVGGDWARLGSLKQASIVWLLRQGLRAQLGMVWRAHEPHAGFSFSSPSISTRISKA
jgi:hypothetical protein